MEDMNKWESCGSNNIIITSFIETINAWEGSGGKKYIITRFIEDIKWLRR